MGNTMEHLKWLPKERLKKLVSLVAILFIINIIIIGSALAIKNVTIKNETIKNEIIKDESRPASVNLHGEKTDVLLGENILIKLSAVNLITNPTMHVQVIIIPPSGMSVTSSEFSKSDAGQFTTNYDLKPGDGKDIEIRIKSNQVGNFSVVGRIIYYFGNDTKNIDDESRNLPIKVRSIPLTYNNWQESKAFLGIVFTVIMLIIIICSAYLLVRRMKRYK